MDPLTRIFWNEGLLYAKHHSRNSTFTGLRKFISFYGIGPNICAIIWKLIKEKPVRAEPKHLLWCLLFFKRYDTEHINAALVDVDEKTFRLWVWIFVDMVARLDVIKWENRFKSSNNTNLYVSLDGTDFRIDEPMPFNAKWYSHKFHGPGLRYEIGISIGNGDIVWASGGLPCGEWPDLKIAQDLYLEYAKNEVTLADKGYRYRNFFKHPSDMIEKRILARHETLNGRLIFFGIFRGSYRHSLKKHPLIFHACINIVQLCIDNGEQLFDL